METDHLDGLTDAQREAVLHRDGACLVVAGPGSGKTRVITRRIVHLLRSGVSSRRILGLTFTNRAAGEMRERVKAMVPESEVWLGTFHSFASRILRRNCQKLNIDKDFHICDEDDRKKLIRETVRGMGLESTAEAVNAISDEISAAKNAMLHPGRFARDARPHQFAAGLVYRQYQLSLRRQNRLDFDDLLNLLAVALGQDEELRSRLDDTFRYVLVDELQDTNPVQFLLLRQLTRDTKNIMGVGDPDQSIYKFRNADIRNILQFQADYQNCRVVKLEANYRSVPEILRVADSLIRRNKERIEKVLIPTRPAGRAVELVGHQGEKAEAKWIAEDVQYGVATGRQYADHAVLVRLNRLTYEVEQAFLRRDIPYKVYGGLGFLGKKEVKDVLAYCRLAVVPTDLLAFARVVNEPNRGIGKVTLDRILAWAEANACPPLAACRQAGRIEGVSRKAAEAATVFADLIDTLHSLTSRPAEVVTAAALQSGYRAALVAEETKEAVERVEAVDRLCELARHYAEDQPDGTLTDFLERMALGEEEEREEGEEEPDRVKIMTMHGAKGLEFPVVYLPGLEEGILPGSKSIQAGDPAEIEEERRVAFVGITRAMDRLVLSACKFRVRDGRPEFCTPSRFLDELPHGEMAINWLRD